AIDAEPQDTGPVRDPGSGWRSRGGSIRSGRRIGPRRTHPRRGRGRVWDSRWSGGPSAPRSEFETRSARGAYRGRRRDRWRNSHHSGAAMTHTFDAIIIGAGQAGPSLAGRLTAAGQSVALIERKLVGGTCVNTGCMPTKALVASAYAAHLARRTDLGVVVPGEVQVDFPRVMARARTLAENSRNRLA